MNNNFNQAQPDTSSSPSTPRPPMQYFTSGSNHGTPPRFTSSTPNYQYRTPRVQHPYRSPYGGSPYDSGYANNYSNRSNCSSQYTPSPVRPRTFHNNPRGSFSTSPYGNRNCSSSPGSSYGRTGTSYRGRGMVSRTVFD